MSNLFTNNAIGALASSITNSQTSITLGAGQGALFASPSAPDYTMVTLFQYGTGGEINHEIVKVTARATDTLTVVRAQESTTGRAFNAGDLVECRVTAGAMNNPSPQKTTYGQVAVFETVKDLGSVSSTLTLAFDTYQNAKFTLTGTATITLGATPGGLMHAQAVITQDASGNRNPVWAGIPTTNWLNSPSVPPINLNPNGRTLFNAWWTGTEWFASLSPIGI